MTRRIGLLVNPIAGMGGAVGLKGTDGKVEEARRLGAKERALPRAVAFLRALSDDVDVVTAGGAMGDDACAEAGLSALVVYAPREPTAADDTKEAAAALADAGIDVLVFVGGDGTAADVATGLSRRQRQGADEPGSSSAADVADGLRDRRVPALGVPSGSKMYSAVFADTPEAAAAVIATFDTTQECEVLDIDEEAFRRGELRVGLHGTLHVPTHERVQGGKSAGDDDDVEIETLGPAVAETLEPDRVHVLGAGSTMLSVKHALRIDGTLLGLDVVRTPPANAPEGTPAQLLVKDAREEDLLQLDSFRIVLSPIGAQGFFLGRGNLPLTPEVLRRIRLPDDVLVVASPSKLLVTPTLKVDTGDAQLDHAFPRFIAVQTGHGQTKLMRVST